jgi:hypothetical protein
MTIAGWHGGVVCGFHQLHVCSVCLAAEFQSLKSSSTTTSSKF